VSGSNLFAGTYGGVFLSTNNGTSWTAVNTGFRNTSVPAFAVSDSNLFAGTYGGGVFLSTNNGTTWVNSGLSDLDVIALVVHDSNLFAGTGYGGVFLSTNNGTSWTDVDSGLMNAYVYSLAMNDSNLFAGTADGGVWRRPLSEMITAVEEDFFQAPFGFTLEQNYPNPFNPTTTIRYELSKSTQVILNIYDTLGQEVRTLVNERQTAGLKSVVWDGRDAAGQAVSSGVYIYRLQAGESVQTRKMSFVR
jgi:ligand-binding sensor domain-containing protein